MDSNLFVMNIILRLLHLLLYRYCSLPSHNSSILGQYKGAQSNTSRRQLRLIWCPALSSTQSNLILASEAFLLSTDWKCLFRNNYGRRGSFSAKIQFWIRWELSEILKDLYMLAWGYPIIALYFEDLCSYHRHSNKLRSRYRWTRLKSWELLGRK